MKYQQKCKQQKLTIYPHKMALFSGGLAPRATPWAGSSDALLTPVVGKAGDTGRAGGEDLEVSRSGSVRLVTPGSEEDGEDTGVRSMPPSMASWNL